jgi:hypothetical protein
MGGIRNPHAGLAIWLTIVIIPAGTVIALCILNSFISDPGWMLLVACAGYFADLALVAATRKAVGWIAFKSGKQAVKKIILVFVKAVIFVVAFWFVFANILTGNIPLEYTCSGRKVIDELVLWIYLGVYFGMAFIMAIFVNT